MNVLVFNCGSSSLKYRLIRMPEENEIAGGEAQRVGPRTAEPPRILHRVRGETETHLADMPDHAAAFDQVMALLGQGGNMMPDVVAHRVVHGGGRFDRAALVSDASLAELEAVKSMAPIHNPPAMKLIYACRERYPSLPQVAVFDTAFHDRMPGYALEYALPRPLVETYGIRKYGFHGISHGYVTTEAARLLGKPLDEFSGVSCHLGSGGASLCAVVNGRSVDNTMGYSPLQGLIMSTRCGDLDPAVVLRMFHLEGDDISAVEKVLNKNSGVLGLSGESADIRDVLAAAVGTAGDNDRAALAREVYLWRLRKYLGAYLTVAGSADAVVFTDTIGETVPAVRWAVCAGLEVFGLKLDALLNSVVERLPADVAAADSAVRALVIATNEEISIAREAATLLSGLALKPKGARQTQ